MSQLVFLANNYPLFQIVSIFLLYFNLGLQFFYHLSIHLYQFLFLCYALFHFLVLRLCLQDMQIYILDLNNTKNTSFHVYSSFLWVSPFLPLIWAELLSNSFSSFPINLIEIWQESIFYFSIWIKFFNYLVISYSSICSYATWSCFCLIICKFSSPKLFLMMYSSSSLCFGCLKNNLSSYYEEKLIYWSIILSFSF